MVVAWKYQWQWTAAAAAFLFFSAFCWTGCEKLGIVVSKTQSDADKLAETMPEVVIPVEAAFPGREDISAYIETFARVIAERRVDVVSKGVGECMELHVEEGDAVTKGQVLAELDKEEPVAALRQLEIQSSQTKTSYEIAEKSLAEGLGAKVERDNARFAYEQAEATLAAQRIRVENLTVRAPIGGIVTRRNVQKGQMVSAGIPVFSIVDPDSYILEINPVEQELSRLKEGQPARVNIDALGGQEFTATVRRINPSVDPVFGTIKVVLDFVSEDRPRLRESAFARVRLEMDTHRRALVLPKEALVEENGRKYLFVVSEQDKKPNKEDKSAEEPAETKPSSDPPAASTGTEKNNEDDKKVSVAERVEVETGFEDSLRVEVLSGIADDALVVTLGQQALKSGVQVNVTNAQELIEKTSKLPAEDALKAAREARAKRTNKEPN